MLWRGRRRVPLRHVQRRRAGERDHHVSSLAWRPPPRFPGCRGEFVARIAPVSWKLRRGRGHGGGRDLARVSATLWSSAGRTPPRLLLVVARICRANCAGFLDVAARAQTRRAAAGAVSDVAAAGPPKVRVRLRASPVASPPGQPGGPPDLSPACDLGLAKWFVTWATSRPAGSR